MKEHDIERIVSRNAEALGIESRDISVIVDHEQESFVQVRIDDNDPFRLPIYEDTSADDLELDLGYLMANNLVLEENALEVPINSELRNSPIGQRLVVAYISYLAARKFLGSFGEEAFEAYAEKNLDLEEAFDISLLDAKNPSDGELIILQFFGIRAAAALLDEESRREPDTLDRLVGPFPNIFGEIRQSSLPKHEKMMIIFGLGMKYAGSVNLIETVRKGYLVMHHNPQADCKKSLGKDAPDKVCYFVEHFYSNIIHAYRESFPPPPERVLSFMEKCRK